MIVVIILTYIHMSFLRFTVTEGYKELLCVRLE